jgi:hypothetical protein
MSQDFRCFAVEIASLWDAAAWWLVAGRAVARANNIASLRDDRPQTGLTSLAKHARNPRFSPLGGETSKTGRLKAEHQRKTRLLLILGFELRLVLISLTTRRFEVENQILHVQAKL